MVSLLVCGDLHLRKNMPKMRIDNFWESQKAKLKFIFQTAMEYNCEGIVFPGDVFDKADASYSLIRFAIKQFGKYHGKCFFVFGNHDLRYHTSDQTNTPLGVLVASMKSKAVILSDIPYMLNDWALIGCSWNQVWPTNRQLKKYEHSIIVSHRPVGLKPPIWVQENFITAKALLKECKADVFITGDNHERFIFTRDNRFVINMGGVQRTNIDQVKHKPALTLLELNEIPSLREIEIPIQKNVFDKIKAEAAKEAEIQKNERLQAYTESMKKEFNAELSFIDNLGVMVQKSKKGVRKIIDEVLN